MGLECFHCGTPCGHDGLGFHEKSFCCQGCLNVYRLLMDHGLEGFYNMADEPGVTVNPGLGVDRYTFLDDPKFQEQWVDYADEKRVKVNFRLPSIHCIACVWLLENLFQIEPGIGHSTVDFPEKRLSLEFDPSLRLSQVAALLGSLGYEPDLTLADINARPKKGIDKRRWLQVGVAGFSFGNIMLFSLPSYLGLDTLNGEHFQSVFAWLSLVLSIPVLVFSAQDYWKAAWLSLSKRILALDVPIALGMAALFGQSAFMIVSGRGEGYLDSLSGLVFFLLCGKIFQEKTYDRLSFDRDYQSFFPLSVTRKRGAEEKRVILANLLPGDHVVIRHGELIPADSILVEGDGVIDYSFVTGESDPVVKRSGDRLYAGGRQMGGLVEVKLQKSVSQSYLTSLWNQEAFHRDRCEPFSGLIHRYSRYFTVGVLLIAVLASIYWGFFDPSKAVTAFVAVLIVACPCALALAAPFTFGTGIRMLARFGVFVRDAHVLEEMARVNALVFDKTGTLTSTSRSVVTFHGEPLTVEEARGVYSLVRHSTHPHSVRIRDWMQKDFDPEPVEGFREVAGLGIEARVNNQRILLGSENWLKSRRTPVQAGIVNASLLGGSVVHVSIESEYRGFFMIQHHLRPFDVGMWERLGRAYRLVLLSGDHDGDAERLKHLFGSGGILEFQQSPQDKLDYIRNLGRQGYRVMMIGDGLNDAGALKQSNVGVAVTEDLNHFSPSSDVILSADRVPAIERVIRYARECVSIMKLCLWISAFYNVVGIGFAVSGLLSPVLCAVLMPLSSVTVVVIASGLAGVMAVRTGLNPERVEEGKSWA